MRSRRWLLAGASLALTAIALGVALRGSADGRAQRSAYDSLATPAPADGEVYRRIVSLSPSVTECLFALGLGERVVAVTDFCDYPPEALSKSKVGGYYDLNYEAIMALRPDLLVCLPTHAGHLADLDRLDLPHLTVDHRRTEAILESLTILGDTCGVPERARRLVQEIRQRMTAVQNRAIDRKRPRVLISVGRNMDSSAIDNVYIAGRGGFYDEMITLAGGVNAYQEQLLFPVVTGEGLLRMQPEIIIDMVADLSEKGLTESEVLRQWDSLEDLTAVQQGQVHVFTEGFVVVPGPRFIQTLEKMATVIHPEGVRQ